MGLFENQMKSTGSKNTDKNVSLKVCIQFSGVSEPYTGFTDPQETLPQNINQGEACRGISYKALNIKDNMYEPIKAQQKKKKKIIYIAFQ